MEERKVNYGELKHSKLIGQGSEARVYLKDNMAIKAFNQNGMKKEEMNNKIYKIKELYHYPGGLNRRIRWESAEMTEPDDNVYSLIISKAEGSVSETVKKAKNELKNTLSDPSAAFLVPFDSIEFSVSDGHAVLKYNDETITLRSNENYPDTCKVLSVLGKESLENGALLGEMFYSSTERKFYLCPVSIVNPHKIIRLC